MAGNHVLLETISLTQSASSVTFDNIPQTGYTDLKIEISSRNTSSGTSWSDLFLNVNGQGAATNVSIKHLYGTGSAIGSNTGGDGISVGNVNPNGTTANSFASTTLYFPNYTSSNAKSFSSEAVTEQNATAALTSMSAGLWNQTAAITSLTFTTDSGTSFAAYSTFSLYGVAATGTTPAVAPLATGGNIVANDGTYWYHAFLTSGAFTPQKELTCDYLVVAGGGGGGNGQGGGGGGGGLRSTVTATGGGGSLPSARTFSSQVLYTVTVGAGGAGTAVNSAPGTSGSNSLISGAGFTTISTSGGGGGGGNTSQAIGSGKSGGSGGGGSGDYATTGGSGTANEGYAGGAGEEGTSGNRPSGGGGGAGQAGIAGTSSNAGNGGNGVQITALATPTLTGANSGYYAGGGGGGGSAAGGSNPGGSGGGGAGSTGTGTNGVASTGGGGGGSAASQLSGNGGSGIVIIRYSMAS